MGRAKLVVVIGLGRLGLLQALWYSSQGYEVIGFDSDNKRIERLNKGIIDGKDITLKQLFDSYGQTIVFSSSVEKLPRSPFLFAICTETTFSLDGKMDLSLFNCAIDILMKKLIIKTTVIIYSVVPLNTNKKIEKIFKKNNQRKIAIISMPIFALDNNLFDAVFNPKAMLAGVNDDESHLFISMIYFDFIIKDITIVFTDSKTAEISVYIKAMYSFMNRNMIEEIKETIINSGSNLEHLSYFFHDCFDIIDFSNSKFMPSFAEEYGCSALLLQENDENDILRCAYTKQCRNIKDLLKLSDEYGSVGIIGIESYYNSKSITNSLVVMLIRKLLEKEHKVFVYDRELLIDLEKKLGRIANLYYCYDEDSIFQHSEIIYIFSKKIDNKESKKRKFPKRIVVRIDDL